ncbi:MAG: PD40 domain-containing protein [Myxococcales bacterium]|nr:PD40 domain-containing protein [Myxococcales bacterium]
MKSSVVAWLCVICGGCGNVTGVADAPPAAIDAAVSDATPGVDGPGTDAPVSQARCDPAKPFNAPVLLANVNSSNEDLYLALTRDEKTALIGRVVQPPTPSATILGARRASVSDSFGVPDATVTAMINGAAGEEYSPSLVADGLIVYFHRQAPGSGAIGIFAATRANDTAVFSAGTSVFVDGTALTNALSPTISADGQTLYWLDFSDFGKVYAATRNGEPTSFITKRSPATVALGAAPVLSADELTMYYATGSSADVLVSTRTTKTASFGTGVPVANVNSAASDVPVALSNDGCVLYLSSARGGLGGPDLWAATRPL